MSNDNSSFVPLFGPAANHRAKHWAHKRHQYHPTGLLVTHKQNEILHSTTESSIEKPAAQ